jgi:zinc and cadmium transporter
MVHVLFTLLSVFAVSVISVIGILFLWKKDKQAKPFLLLLVGLSAGSLFGGALLHLLPEAVKEIGFTIPLSIVVLSGIVCFFLLEKGIHFQHCHAHHMDTGKHAHEHASHHMAKLAPLNLIGDGVHNFIDGIIIAGAFIVDTHLGLATVVAVIFHEIPQEFADFGVLIYAGLTKGKALFYNFLSALLAVFGAVLVLIIGTRIDPYIPYLLAFGAGGFLYIAGSALIPELHKDCSAKDSFFQFMSFILGIGLMVVMVLLE